MIARSYTSRQGGLLALPSQGAHLLKSHYAGDFAGRVASLIGRAREIERVIARSYGAELTGLRMLDVGAGQRLVQSTYFAQRNDVTGIDLDVVVNGFHPLGYVRMLRSNGTKRTVKTIARKLLLVDARYRRELRRQLGTHRLPRPRALQMDAGEMTFPDASFDVVYSLSVFSHVSDPASVIAEMNRVLRPGGVAYASFLLFTSRTGCMDIRVLGGRTADIPLWAHLRPQHAGEVQESAYLNKIRLPQWRELFSTGMPGCEFILGQYEREQLLPAAEQLREAGELLEYDLEELVTADFGVVWRKPAELSSR